MSAYNLDTMPRVNRPSSLQGSSNKIHPTSSLADLGSPWCWNSWHDVTVTCGFPIRKRWVCPRFAPFRGTAHWLLRKALRGHFAIVRTAVHAFEGRRAMTASGGVVYSQTTGHPERCVECSACFWETSNRSNLFWPVSLAGQCSNQT